MITYLFHTSLLLSGFTLFYWFVLRRETYFRLNRWVTLICILSCLALPLIQIPASLSLWNNTDTPTASIIKTITDAPSKLVTPVEVPAIESSTSSNNSATHIADTGSTFNWASILGILYVIGIIIFFLVFLMQIVILLTQRYNLNSFQTGKYTIVEMVKDAEPCSFMNYIFINPEKYDSETYHHIIEHEKAHIDQSHFIDKVIAELLVVVFWFNPFTWLLRKSIGQNLEFLTDQSLLKQGIQKDKYQMSLLKVSVSNRPLNLTSSYNSSFLKSRILMMNSKNSSVVAAWKYLFILPLFILSIASLNAIQSGGNQANQAQHNWAPTPDMGMSAAKSDVTSTSTVGDHINTRIELPHINKIGLAMTGNLFLSYGDKQKISIAGPEELIDQINTNVVGGNWSIEYETPGLRKRSREITVFAQLTELTHLAISGEGNIVTKNRFENLGEVFLALSGAGNIEFIGNAEKINTGLSGTGNIRIDGNANYMSTALSGTGNITLTGQSIATEIICSGSGNVSADDLASQRSKVIIDGSSSVSINASDLIDVTAAGNAKIRYHGNPKIIKDLKSESSLIKVE